MADSAGTTLMDLITSDPSPAPAPASTTTSSSAASARSPSPARMAAASSSSPSSTLGKPATGERRSKRATLMQIQNDAISAAKALNPIRANQKQRKKVHSRLPPPSRYSRFSI
ncbi:uncharacterized protein M6B38_416045 [Iris pallida]|uniref:Uncharacterized protein n=1 Tax=Iris pallida TaxID=29817 RepID=A0AAX6F115_IRIPA|nr:uncharacterized protein M6B38_162195 [Iris pallida]KAJ6816880.1 uncharacterized protein M6B38_416045 [Iris pallida]